MKKSNNKLPSSFTYTTAKCLKTVNFTSEYIGNIIQALNSNKAHGRDKISTCMLKICGNSVCKPLEIICKKCPNVSAFLLKWKKGGIVPIYKKGGKQCPQKYKPVSLLPVCGKIMEKHNFDKMFEFFFNENKLIATNQSGFKPGDSCISQLLSITYDIYKLFDEKYEVRGMFLDILNTFDNAWYRVFFSE